MVTAALILSSLSVVAAGEASCNAEGTCALAKDSVLLQTKGSAAKLSKSKYNCFTENAYWDWATLDNIPGQGRSAATSAIDCAHRCQQTNGCSHFSYWSDGGCHIGSGEGSTLWAWGVTSGPRQCPEAPPPAPTNQGGSDSGASAGCPITSARKHVPLNMPGQARTSEASAEACRERCANTAGCAYFTFWSDGGCHLQDASATETHSTHNVRTGPVHCNGEAGSGQGAVQWPAPVEMAAGQTGCPPEDTAQSKEQCRWAIESLGWGLANEGWEGDYNQIPVGCSFRAEGEGVTMHWNTATHGRGRGDLRPVCLPNIAPGAVAPAPPPPPPGPAIPTNCHTPISTTAQCGPDHGRCATSWVAGWANKKVCDDCARCDEATNRCGFGGGNSQYDAGGLHGECDPRSVHARWD